jgi:hypothetical protein
MSMKPKIFAVLGADRVGKSTFIESSYCTIGAFNKNVHKLHFSGPKPEHNTPIDQYIFPLNELIKEKSPEFILCDRGFSEVCFYEKFRRNIVISDEWAVAAESYFKAISDQIHVLMIQRDWEWSHPKHIQEIDKLYPDASNYFKRNQLLVREKEHVEYYNYMLNYLEHTSTLPFQVIKPRIAESVLDYILV